MRRFLVIIEDERSEFSNCEALEAFLSALFEEVGMKGAVARVQQGGLLAMKIMDELPPVRHRDMGRARS